MKLFEIFEKIDTEKEPEEISVVLSSEMPYFCRSNLAQESVWMDSNCNDWKYRIDPENPNIPQQRHIHIAKSKHTNAKNMQASWNSDGTRDDRRSFNTKIGNFDRVREIARNVLNIKMEITLENHNYPKPKQVLTEEISLSADGKIAYIFHSPSLQETLHLSLAAPKI